MNYICKGRRSTGRPMMPWNDVYSVGGRTAPSLVLMISMKPDDAMEQCLFSRRTDGPKLSIDDKYEAR
jgi:hypothetical protein